MKRFRFGPWKLQSGPNAGRTVVDEMCYCGAKRTEHKDTTAQGHGSCPETGCPKFTWKSFVYADEARS